LFVINFFWSLARGRRAEANPWQAARSSGRCRRRRRTTTSIACRSCATARTSSATRASVAALGRDWIAQDEEDLA